MLIHQPHGGASGQAVDIEIQAKEIIRMRESLDEILAHHTGQTVEKVAKDTDRDFIMSATEAKEYGIVDEVITNRELAAVAGAGRRELSRRRDRTRGGASWPSSVTVATC